MHVTDHMRIDRFWKTWIAEYRNLWYVVTIAGLCFLLFLWFSRFEGPSGVIKWNKLQEQKTIETTVHSFQLGPFNISIPGDSYVILEYFHGSEVTPNAFASYAFLAGLIFGVTILLTAITTLDKFWYLGGMAFFILFMVTLRLEVLGIFGMYNRIPDGIALALFVITSFYFNRINHGISFVARWLTFIVIWIFIAVVIGAFSQVNYPFYHLTLTGYTAGIVISILFIIIVSHEVLAGFIYIVGQSNAHSLRHFFLITVFYMGNLIITCFHELGYIEWKFVYIDPYLLLTVSSVLGLWGLRQRESQYEGIFRFAPVGALGFVAMAIICYATIGQLLGNWNDPSLKIMRDAIIFSHTAFGVIFLVYIFSNFILLLARNLPVYKVLYNPTRMPYFTFQFAGLIAMLAFIFYSNWRTYLFNGMASFYNTTGDLYTLLENEVYAESFYEQGARQGFQNNRSNYALGVLKSQRFNFESAHEHYALANDKRPTVYSLVNQGNLYVWENDMVEAINAYRDGYRQIPDSPELENNLGFAYARMHQLDSAIVFLNRAREAKLTRVSAETNFFALAALELIPIKTDSILGVFGTSETPVIANALALSTLQGQELKTTVLPLKEKHLNLYSATLLNNYAIKYATKLDTAFLSEAYAIASDSMNGDFSEALKSSLAFGYYHQGNISRALQILAELVYVSQDYKGKFNYIMGLWALEQGNPELASTYFTFADTYDYKEARFYNAIALSEAGQNAQASQAWDSVLVRQKGDLQAIALQMKRILSIAPTAALSMNDAEKYQYCRYRIGIRDSLTANMLLNRFEDPNYKAQAILDISRKYYDAGMPVPAIVYFNRIAGLELTDKRLYEDIRHFELLMLADKRDMAGLARQINNGIEFDSNRTLEKQYYTALIAEANGDTLLASKNYKLLSAYNPYLEEGIIAAADYFRRHDKNKLRAYNILAEAIQINSNSIRLLRAYVAEASRVGFDQYAYDAGQRLLQLENSLR